MRILVFQHIAVEHPGAFRDIWAGQGHTWRSVELDLGEPIPALDDFNLLVVMGGPMDVWQEGEHPWLVPEKAAIRRWVKDLGRPFLGVCLGHQLLADALGGKVTPMRQPEVGVAGVELTAEGRNDPLLAGCGDKMQALQWHGAEVSVVPAGGHILATNAASSAQAMRWGRCAYGLQYHVEITAATVDEWKSVPEYAASLERTLGADGATRLDQDVAEKLPDFRTMSHRIGTNLTTIVERAISGP